MNISKFRLNRMSTLILLAGLSSPMAAMAIEIPGGTNAGPTGASINAGRVEALRSDPRVGDATAPCPTEVLEEIISNYQVRRSNSVMAGISNIGTPTKSDSIDCFSSLMDADFSFNIPPASQIARSVFDQLKQAACRIAVNKSNQMLDTSGLNFNQDFGPEFYIPGTNERIDVDAGGASGGLGGGLQSNTSGRSQQGGVSGGATGTITEGGGVSAGGSVSGGRSAGDLDSFLKGIF